MVVIIVVGAGAGIPVRAGQAVDAAVALAPEGLEVLLEGGDAPLDVRVRVRRQLHLDGLEADAQVLQLVVVVFEFALTGGVLVYSSLTSQCGFPPTDMRCDPGET